MLIKILTFFAILWFLAVTAVWLVSVQIKRLFRPNKRTEQQKTTQESSFESEKLVKCHQCGTYIPSEQAVQVGEYYYCNQQCKSNS